MSVNRLIRLDRGGISVHSSRIDETLRNAVESGKVAGVVACAADEKGPAYEGAFGTRTIGDATPMTPDTVFWIASMTKAITSVAALQLVERGKLALDAPIGTVLPQLAAPRILEGFDDDGTPRTRQATRPITLRQLLTHTAGFGYNLWSEDLLRYQEREGIPAVGSCENAALNLPLLFEPGERWMYGINLDFVGKAVEAASGQPLDVYLRENIFAPLGMNDTAFTLTTGMRTRLAGMHARLPDGSLEAIPFELPQQPEFFMGGGGLYGTGRDYLVFLQMLLHGGTFRDARVLQPETAAQTLENHIGELEVGYLKSAIPGSTNDMDFYGPGHKWGLGFLLHSSAGAGGRAKGSVSWAGLGNTYFWIDPTARLCGVILTQILPFADPAVLGLFERFEAGIYAEARSVPAGR